MSNSGRTFREIAFAKADEAKAEELLKQVLRLVPYDVAVRILRELRIDQKRDHNLRGKI